MPADPSNDLLLITSASGHQASTLLPLLSKWKHLRLAVKSSTSKEHLQNQYPTAEVIQTDIYNPNNCAALFKNVTAALHIGPSYHAHEGEIGRMMIDAAVQEYDNGKGTFKHFILSSVLNSQLSKMMNHDVKKHVEEYILESGLPYTILQPSTFMDNIPVGVLAGEENPVFEACWNTENLFSMLALSDLAAVMKTVLEQRDKHFYAQYPLTSTNIPISFRTAVHVISQKSGKEVRIEKLEYKDAVECLLTRLFGKSEGVDDRSRDTAQRMILFYDNRGLVGNSNVLEWVLGRKATQFEEWVEGKVQESRKSL